MPAKLHRHQYYTYVLMNTQGYYVGMSNNIPRRFGEHQAGECQGSQKLGRPLELELVWIWTSPGFRLSSKLERFIHRAQRESGTDHVLQVIDTMPIYTQELQDLIDAYMPTTLFERQMELHDQIQEKHSQMKSWGPGLLESIREAQQRDQDLT